MTFLLGLYLGAAFGFACGFFAAAMFAMAGGRTGDAPACRPSVGAKIDESMTQGG